MIWRHDPRALPHIRSSENNSAEPHPCCVVGANLELTRRGAARLNCNHDRLAGCVLVGCSDGAGCGHILPRLPPIQEQYRKQMNRLAKLIDEFFNGRRKPNRKPTVGFILLTAEFGKIEGGRVNYISNGNREDMIAMMREYLARIEGRYSEGSETKQ